MHNGFYPHQNYYIFLWLLASFYISAANIVNKRPQFKIKNVPVNKPSQADHNSKG
jgi:hypothetical protein